MWKHSVAVYFPTLDEAFSKNKFLIVFTRGIKRFVANFVASCYRIGFSIF